MVKNLRPGPALIAAEISKYLGPVTFLVRVRDGQTWKRHVDHLKVLHDNGLQDGSSTESDGNEFCGHYA